VLKKDKPERNQFSSVNLFLYEKMSGYTNDPDLNPNSNAPMQQARVVHNVDLDKTEIANRHDITRPEPMFPKAADQYDDCVFAREICLTYNPRYREQSSQNKKEIKVFSSLNGAFKKTDSIVSLYDKLMYFGIAGINCYYDFRSERNSHSGLPAALHGTDATTNTGKQRIMSGDLVIYSIPDPKSAPNKPDVPGRYVAETTPYRPHDPMDKNHAILASNMYSLVSARKRSRAIGSFDDHDRTKTEEAAILLRESVLESSLVVMNVLLEAGILHVNPDYLTADEFVDDNDKYDKKTKEDFLGKFINDAHVHGLKDKFRFPKGGKQTSLANHIDKALFSTDSKSRIYERHSIAEESVVQKEVSELQDTCIEYLLKAIEEVNYHFRSRIIGRAMSTADPGESFNIFLSYE
jgi:hypothetical protein